MLATILIAIRYAMVQDPVPDAGSVSVTYTNVSHETPQDKERDKALLGMIDASGRLRFERPSDHAKIMGVEERLSRLYLPLWGRFAGVAKHTQDGKEATVYKWEPADKLRVVKEVRLWIEPDFSLLIVRVNNDMLGSPEKLKDFVARALIIPGHRDITDVRLRLWKDAKAGLMGKGFVAFTALPMANASGFGWSIQLVKSKDESYIVFRMGNRVFHPK